MNAGGFKIGARVRDRRSGAVGTIVGPARPARSAGGALMQRVRWDHPFARDEGSAAFVRRLELER
jgi:hypothetical protein